MNILINCSNLKLGGGVQVADSVCGYLHKMAEHKFVVVLSSYMDATAERMGQCCNVTVVRHDIRNDWRTLLLGRDSVLDSLVTEHEIDAVLTIFGPARWRPRVPHLCGFARPHLILTQSPHFQRMTTSQRIKAKAENVVLGYLFGRSTTAMWTENPMITERVQRLYPRKKVVTVTNNFNQIFRQEDKQTELVLPQFDGTTLLTVSAPYPHKNLEIAIGATQCLLRTHPDFKFRFVMTIDEGDLVGLTDEVREHFIFTGKVDIAQVPSLYRQADICFQPTLLECFTATYAEAMYMRVPIVTTDLDFAHGLCGEAAIYYNALSAEACAEAIYRVATNEELRDTLVNNGNRQLQMFDSAEERARKLMEITVHIGREVRNVNTTVQNAKEEEH